MPNQFSRRSTVGFFGLLHKFIFILLFVSFSHLQEFSFDQEYFNSLGNPSTNGSNQNKSSKKSLSPDMDPLDLKNGSMIPSVYELQGNRDLKLLFYFYYGSNSSSSMPFVLNPRFYSKYIIIQSR
jgi:hypothetical protein